MTTRILALAAFCATGLFAQSFNPQIQITTVRTDYKNLKKQNSPDLKISCQAPSPSSDLIKYCDHLMALFDPTQLKVSFANYVVAQADQGLLKSAIQTFLAQAAKTRIDLQGGSSAAGSGTTSAVERSGISDVVGAAVEAGAVTQSVSGTNLTLQANALSAYRFLRNREVFQYCPQEKANCRGWVEGFLGRVSASTTMEVVNSSKAVTGTVASSGSTPASTTPPTATALLQTNASHLTGLSVRFQPINTLDVRSQAYLDAWKKAIASVQSQGEALNKAVDFNKFAGAADAEQAAWINATRDQLRSLVETDASDQKLIDAITAAWGSQLERWTKAGMTVDDLKKYLATANAYLSARDAAIDKVRQSLASGLTFEYAYSRPDNQPRVSTGRIIYTLHPGMIATDTASASAATTPAAAKPAPQPPSIPANPKSSNDWAITFNFAADMYDNPPPGTKQLRDLQAALQLDHHFGATIGTLSGYYQYQATPAALTISTGNLAPNTSIVLNGPAATLLGPKGNIVVVEAMVTVPFKSSKVPVGITWSNRTELLTGTEVRGHVGINFDWSTLFLQKAASK